MGLGSILYIAFASISLFACFMQLFFSYRKKSDIIFLVSAVLSFIIFLRFSVNIICSEPYGFAEHHLAFLRCELIITQFVILSMLGIIFYLVKDQRKLFILLNAAVIGLLMIMGLVIPDYVLFGTSNSIHLQDLAKIDAGSLIVNGFTWWRAMTDVTILLFVMFAILLMFKNSDLISRGVKIALLSGIGMTLFTAVYDHSLDLGLIHSVYILPYGIFIFYLILIFIPFLSYTKELNERNNIIIQDSKFRILLNEADVIVVGLDRMGHVEFVNPYFFKITGYHPEEVMNKDWFEFFIPSKDFYKLQGAFLEILESEFHPQYYNPILTKNKEEIIVHWFNVRTRDEGGKITGSISVGIDMTGDIREKEELLKRLREAEDLIARLPSLQDPG